MSDTDYTQNAFSNESLLNFTCDKNSTDCNHVCSSLFQTVIISLLRDAPYHVAHYGFLPAHENIYRTCRIYRKMRYGNHDVNICRAKITFKKTFTNVDIFTAFISYL